VGGVIHVHVAAQLGGLAVQAQAAEQTHGPNGGGETPVVGQQPTQGLPVADQRGLIKRNAYDDEVVLTEKQAAPYGVDPGDDRGMVHTVSLQRAPQPARSVRVAQYDG
jgi:hypothetical protein